MISLQQHLIHKFEFDMLTQLTLILGCGFVKMNVMTSTVKTGGNTGEEL